MTEYRLLDPGLVENSSNEEQCVHACYQMVFRTRNGGAVPSFDELDEIMHRKDGKYTFEYNLLTELPNYGFEVEIVWEFNLQALSENPEDYFIKLYGQEVGRITIEESDIETLKVDAKKLNEVDNIRIIRRSANFEDIKGKILDGYYIVCTINQRVLQADPGYVAHGILIFGFNDRGVIIHNPGPPSNAAAEIPWDLFNKSWAYPDEHARNIVAVKPLKSF